MDFNNPGDLGATILSCQAALENASLEAHPPAHADGSCIHCQLARLLPQQGSAEARREVLMVLEETPRHRASLKLLQEIPPADSTPTATPAAPAAR